MIDEDVVIEKVGKKEHSRGSTQPLNDDFAQWLERQFRGGEQPQSIDAYPLYKGRDREQRLYHYDIKGDETITTERAVELSNEIFSDCQIDCDNQPVTNLNKDGSKNYEVAIIDARRGGLAEPAGTRKLKLWPRIHKPAPLDSDLDLDPEDSEVMTARKMMMQIHSDSQGRIERGQQSTMIAVGEIMLLLKGSLTDAHAQNRDLHNSILELLKEQRELVRAEGQRRVEERAVIIDAENAAMERDLKRAQMNKENMWTNVMQAGMMEAVKVLGGLFPGFGQLFSALLQGKPIPHPPQLPSNGTSHPNGPNGVSAGAGPSSQPQLPPANAPTEKVLIDRFVEAAEKEQFDATSTRGDRLFGKDDDKGNPVEAGVFSREQVSILAGVHSGTLSIEALDGLIPGSGKPEEINAIQMAKAIAYMSAAMVADVTKVFQMRKAAKK